MNKGEINVRKETRSAVHETEISQDNAEKAGNVVWSNYTGFSFLNWENYVYQCIKW